MMKAIVLAVFLQLAVASVHPSLRQITTIPAPAPAPVTYVPPASTGTVAPPASGQTTAVNPAGSTVSYPAGTHLTLPAGTTVTYPEGATLSYDYPVNVNYPQETAVTYPNTAQGTPLTYPPGTVVANPAGTTTTLPPNSQITYPQNTTVNFVTIYNTANPCFVRYPTQTTSNYYGTNSAPILYPSGTPSSAYSFSPNYGGRVGQTTTVRNSDGTNSSVTVIGYTSSRYPVSRVTNLNTGVTSVVTQTGPTTYSVNTNGVVTNVNTG